MLYGKYVLTIHNCDSGTALENHHDDYGGVEYLTQNCREDAGNQQDEYEGGHRKDQQWLAMIAA
jgi:hypothetical protein